MKSTLLKLSSIVLLLSIMLIPTIAQATQDENLQVLYVSGETVECVGVAPQSCLQVRSAPDAEWEWHYDGIINFEHEVGVAYTLLVRVLAGDPNLADAPAFRYQLVQVLDRTVVDDELSSLTSFYEPTSEFVVIYVSNETVDCVGVGPQTCMQISFTSDAEWEYFYDNIVDFAYDAGYLYRLVVQRANLTEENLADVSSFIYLLDRIISKTAIDVDAESETTQSLAGTSWVLNGYEVAGTLETLPESINITLNFADGGVSGSAGCNNYSGIYQENGNQLVINNEITRTLMACFDIAMEQETRFLEILPSANTFSIDGTTLRIQYAENSYLVLSSVGD